MREFIEQHWRENYNSLVKQVTFNIGDFNKAVAEEVVQEAYYNALKSSESFDEAKGTFNNWFSNIVRNCMIKAKRVEKLRGANDDDARELENVEVEHNFNLSMKDFNNDLKKFNIPSKYNRHKDRHDTEIVVRLYIEYGFSLQEVADATNMSKSNVKRIIKNFRDWQRNSNRR